MSWDYPELRESAATYAAIQKSLRIAMRGLLKQNFKELNQARGLLRDAAKVLMDRSQQIPAKPEAVRR